MDEVKSQIDVLASLVKLDHEQRMAQQQAFEQKQSRLDEHEHAGSHLALEHAHDHDMTDREHAHQARLATTPPPKDPNKQTKPNGAGDRG